MLKLNEKKKKGRCRLQRLFSCKKRTACKSKGEDLKKKKIRLLNDLTYAVLLGRIGKK